MSNQTKNSNSERKAGPGPGGRRGPGGSHMAMTSTEKATDFKGTMKKLIEYLGAYRRSIVIVMFIAILSTVFMIAGPKIMGNATTKLFEGVMDQLRGGTEGIDFTYIGNILLLTLGLYTISSIFSYIQGWIMSGISADIAYKFRRDIANKINRMPLKYFNDTSQGEVLSRITNDVDTVNGTLSQSLSQMITSIVTVIGVLAMMFSISWQMTLLALTIIPL